MKYQLVFNSNSKLLFKPCESCGSMNHILSDCPAFNHLLSKTRIQSKVNFSQNQTRYNYQRRFQRMNSLSHKQNVEKSHQTFVSNYNFDKIFEIDSLSKIMTDSLEMDMEQSQESPTMLKDSKISQTEENSQKKTSKMKNSAIQSPKLQNERKNSKLKIHLENCKKESENSDGTYDNLPNLGEIKEVQSVLEVEQEENKQQIPHIPTPISTTNLTNPKSGTMTKSEKKHQKVLTVEENMELIHSFDKMKAFVKFMPESNYVNVIQKVNRQMRIILKKKNGLKKKSDKRKKYNTKKSPDSTSSLKKQSPSHRKFSIFKNEIKVLKSFNSRNSWKNN